MIATDARLQAPSRAVVSSPVLAMALFLFTEVMLFAALISSTIVLRGRTGVGLWPPPGQPRLPVLATGLNSLMLLASGVTIWLGVRALLAGRGKIGVRLLWVTLVLGAGFVIAQGVEWVRLVSFGLTTASSLYGSVFYTVVGCHALHVVAALIALSLFVGRSTRDPQRAATRPGRLRAMRLYWSFVVVVWPPLYGLVYLW